MFSRAIFVTTPYTVQESYLKSNCLSVSLKRRIVTRMTNDEQWLLNEKYHGEKTEAFMSDCARLLNDEPLAYVIGHIPFLNTTIYLDLPTACLPDRQGQAGVRPLIPRTETEFWTKHVIDEISAQGLSSVKILDLCAGSGCIGIALLKALHQVTVDFVEIETAHHPTILKNILQNNIDPHRAHIFGGDLFEQVQSTYDYILTNPPYIDAQQERTEESVVRYEPSRALWGGKDGMEIIERILAHARPFLANDGALYIEHEPEQKEAISIHAKLNGFVHETMLDQYGVFRFTRLSHEHK